MNPNTLDTIRKHSSLGRNPMIVLSCPGRRPFQIPRDELIALAARGAAATRAAAAQDIDCGGDGHPEIDLARHATDLLAWLERR